MTKISANLAFYKIINNNLAQTAQFAADGTTPNNNTALKELAGQTTSNGVELDINAIAFCSVGVRSGYRVTFEQNIVGTARPPRAAAIALKSVIRGEV